MPSEITTAVLDWRLNDFAFRCFRDIADGDYICARMAFRADLMGQFLWASQKSIEKYLKCILLLNRIKAVEVRHDLALARKKLTDAGVEMNLTDITKRFIEWIDDCGQYRYVEKPLVLNGTELVELDDSVGIEAVLHARSELTRCKAPPECSGSKRSDRRRRFRRNH
jgi:hypothetical protein